MIIDYFNFGAVAMDISYSTGDGVPDNQVTYSYPSQTADIFFYPGNIAAVTAISAFCGATAAWTAFESYETTDPETGEITTNDYGYPPPPISKIYFPPSGPSVFPAPFGCPYLFANNVNEICVAYGIFAPFQPPTPPSTAAQSVVSVDAISGDELWPGSSVPLFTGGQIIVVIFGFGAIGLF
jgi:hypothetical protein